MNATELLKNWILTPHERAYWQDFTQDYENIDDVAICSLADQLRHTYNSECSNVSYLINFLARNVLQDVDWFEVAKYFLNLSRQS